MHASPDADRFLFGNVVPLKNSRDYLLIAVPACQVK